MALKFNTSIRVYREDLKRGRWSKPKAVSGLDYYGPGCAPDAAEREAREAAAGAGLTVERRRDRWGCSHFATVRPNGATVSRFFYWYIGAGNDARGFLKDRDPDLI